MAERPPPEPDHHRPRRDWRESLWDIGIVVAGVLIALVADQAVDSWGWRQKVGAAEEAMRLELRDDDAPQAYARVVASRCYTEALDRIQAAVEDGRSRAVVRALVAAYAPPFRTWDSEAWEAALSSATASHISPQRMLVWSNPYRLMPAMAQTNREENFHLAPLRAGRRTDGPLAADEVNRLLLAVETLRFDNQIMTTGSRVLMDSVADIGLAVPAARKRAIVSELRLRFGACATEPPAGRLAPPNASS
jgi:hypothetical protein